MAKKAKKKAVKKGRRVREPMLVCRGCGGPIWAHKRGCIFPNLGG